MFVKELLHERNLLRLTMNHHLEKLNARDTPPGILLCHRHKNGFRWQHKYLKDGRAVTVDLSKTEKALAEKLAVNLYRMTCIRYLQKQITSLNNLIISLHSEIPFKTNALVSNNDPTTELSLHLLLHKVKNCPRVPAGFFRSQSPYRSFLLSYMEREFAWIINWYLGDFVQNREHPEHLLYPVKLGYNVRSKSEVIAANRLFEEGILFHYEELILQSDEDSFSDFYIPITILEKYVWEHFGAVDKEGYFHRTKGKVSDYMNHQWFPGINMITTYETRQHPLTEEMVDHKIRWLKNRYRLAFPDLPPDGSFNLYDLAAFVKSSRIGQ